eukprot:jgi/Tetstr1/454155/TSEL_041074.t1
MRRHAVVCWPACPDSVRRDADAVARANGGRLAHEVTITSASQLDALLVQAYAEEVLKSSGDAGVYDGIWKRATGLGSREGSDLTAAKAVCLSFRAGTREAPGGLAEALRNGTAWTSRDEERVDRVTLAFAHPLLHYQGFAGARTSVMLGWVMSIRRRMFVAEKLPPRGAVFLGDAAMLCHGLRLPREHHLQAVLTADGEKVRRGAPTRTARLKVPGRGESATVALRVMSAADWRLENDILAHYHGIDVPAAIARDGGGWAMFMGLMTPPAEVSHAISRSRIGGVDSAVHLLDTMALRALAGIAQPLPCVFATSPLADTADKLGYASSLITSAIERYTVSRETARAALCAGRGTEATFSVRETPEAAAELSKAQEIHSALKGMPVLPLHFGLLDCGDTGPRLAVEFMDMTLVQWMRAPRTYAAWLSVLGRVAWCVSALENVGGMRHEGLRASHVMLRNTEGADRRRAAAVRLEGTLVPDAGWDVRITGLEHMVPAPRSPARKSGAPVRNALWSLVADIGESLLPRGNSELRRALAKLAPRQLPPRDSATRLLATLLGATHASRSR